MSALNNPSIFAVESMKIVADENIPFAKWLFSEFGELTLLPGRDLSRDRVCDAEVLLVRSVTPVNANLLDGSRVAFVGTCTIGIDHLDAAYLNERGIVWHSAPGCNAMGVVQYVVCALSALGRLRSGLRVAVVGCGNVGGRVIRQLSALGMDCIGVDPHIESADFPLGTVESIYDCDVVCLHTPRVLDGSHPTEKLIDGRHLAKLKPGALLLNAGRGECIDNEALLQHLKSGAELDVVLDVWAGEPNMNPDLHRLVKLGTPHIAGYSFEGRVNGSTMIFTELARYLGRSEAWISARLDALHTQHFGAPEALSAESLEESLRLSYDIAEDHRQLGAALATLPKSFDALRKQYPKRREFSHYRIGDVGRFAAEDVEKATALGLL